MDGRENESRVRKIQQQRKLLAAAADVETIWHDYGQYFNGCVGVFDKYPPLTLCVAHCLSMWVGGSMRIKDIILLWRDE